MLPPYEGNPFPRGAPSMTIYRSDLPEIEGTGNTSPPSPVRSIVTMRFLCHQSRYMFQSARALDYRPMAALFVRRRIVSASPSNCLLY
jgi:hypothetical protein